MLACVINGKTPYEMRNNKKPNLASIQKFGAAAYVKDLKAGKLDTRVKVGCFIGYYSESKGYQIYWLEKRSITVERNMIFNQDNVCTSEGIAIVYGETQFEGEINKVIQANQNNVKEVKEHVNDETNHQQSQKQVPEPHQNIQPSNSVAFLSKDDFQVKSNSELREGNRYGCRKRNRPPQGAFKAMNKGTAAITLLKEPDQDPDGYLNTLVGYSSADLKTLDKVL